MSADEAELLLSEIGQRLLMDIDYPSVPTLLYAQLDHNFVSESIYKDIGNQLLFRWTTDRRLPDDLLALWEAQGSGARWSEMEYLLRDGRFEVRYFYPDEIDSEEDMDVRREAALRRHFGDKPIIYPAWPPPDDIFDDL